MSSDSRWSFRARAKDKFQKLVQSNLTSSIKEKISKNGTLTELREKSRNYTNTFKEQIHYSDLKNKTLGYIDVLSPSNQTSTNPKGFLDSLFSPQTIDETYMKTAIICLWTIAMFSILATIVTIFIPISKNPSGTMRVKLIFLHIFLCEFCYLIYIVLSMINVSLDYQLNTFWCDIAEYGMYATVPIMCFTLLVLSIERLTNRCKPQASWTKLCTNPFVPQIVLLLIWIITIAIIGTIVYLKTKVKDSLKKIPGKLLSSRLGKVFVSNQCSIDGQLLAPFKILFLILFIVIIVLIIKSMVITFFYSTIFTPSFFQKKKNDSKKPKENNHMSFIFLMFLLLNLVLSSPFYFVSTGSSLSNILRKDVTFSMKLKITFILRLISIILQCFIFYIYEKNCWFLLSKCIYCVSMKKINLTKYMESESVREEKNQMLPSDEDQSDNENNSEPASDIDDKRAKAKPTKNDTTDKDREQEKSKKLKKKNSSSKANGKSLSKKEPAKSNPTPPTSSSSSSSDSDDDDDDDDDEKKPAIPNSQVQQTSHDQQQNTESSQQVIHHQNSTNQSGKRRHVRKKKLCSREDEV